MKHGSCDPTPLAVTYHISNKGSFKEPSFSGTIFLMLLVHAIKEFKKLTHCVFTSPGTQRFVSNINLKLRQETPSLIDSISCLDRSSSEPTNRIRLIKTRQSTQVCIDNEQRKLAYQMRCGYRGEISIVQRCVRESVYVCVRGCVSL